jgi:DNA-binding IclR family transcriptional regulator
MSPPVGFLLYGTRGGTERRALLTALADGPADRDELVSATGLPPATVDGHVAALRANGFVESTTDAAGTAGGRYDLADGVDPERL